MPASSRIHGSRSRSRPYDRRSPTTSPTQTHTHTSPPPASPVSTPIASQNPSPSNLNTPLDHPGLPTYAAYKGLEGGYLASLSPRKRDKALITQAMFDKIWDVLHQPDACTIETPQFRFWVRKMFVLSRPDSDAVNLDQSIKCEDRDKEEEDEDEDETKADIALERAMGINRADSLTALTAVVLHEHRPVAIKEQLYELFCYCHVRAGHGGRDKTCAVIRQHYSWVPKELTAQFVKACPTCALKRSGGVVQDLGVLPRRGRGRAGKRKMAEESVGDGKDEEVDVEPLELAWPKTGGPLDPANPPPCGVRHREREDSGGSPVRHPEPTKSPLASRVLSTLVDTTPSPFRLYDPIHNPGHPVPVVDMTRSPKTGLPSLASALSNESLDDNVVLTELGATDDPSLPPALQPLRLSGPLADSEAFEFQIDPMLLTLGYPQPGLEGPGMSSTMSMSCAYADDRTRLYPFRTRAIMPMDLDLGATLPLDARYDSVSTSTHPSRRDTSPVFKPLSQRSRWYEDGPLATMLLPCSTDDSGADFPS